MYAVKNVEKFLQDNKGLIDPKTVAGILKRAKAHGEPDGVLVAGVSSDVFRDESLEQEFGRIIAQDPEHAEIGIAAMRQRI